MGLRTFHLFFIIVATAACIGFGLWCFLTQAGSEFSGSRVWGAISLLAGVGLVIYGIRFRKKLDKEGIE